MPDLIQKQPEEERLAVPTTRFSAKYFIPEQKYTEALNSTSKPVKQNITIAPTELFPTTALAQQTMLPSAQKTEFTISNIAARAKERANKLFSLFILLFSSKYMQRRRQGALALNQLKYLAALCSATSSFTNEEAIIFETAFGEAYYNMLQQAKAPHKESEEQQLRLHSSFKSLLRAMDSV